MRDPWWLYAMLVACILLALASMVGHVWQAL